MPDELAPHLPKGKPVVLCAKGLEQATGKLLGEVIGEALPQATQAVLSGPSFAADVARGLAGRRSPSPPPTRRSARQLATALGYRHLRIYWSGDLIGVQLGGAVKNVLAIAAGIVDGRGLGASAHAALVTRGFAELRRFGEALGRQTRDADGPVRSRRPAAHLRQPAVAQHEPRPRAGAGTDARRPCSAAGARWRKASTPRPRSTRVAAEKGIDMPICQAVHAIVDGKMSIDAAIEALLSRPFKAEG